MTTLSRSMTSSVIINQNGAYSANTYFVFTVPQGGDLSPYNYHTPRYRIEGLMINWVGGKKYHELTMIILGPSYHLAADFPQLQVIYFIIFPTEAIGAGGTYFG